MTQEKTLQALHDENERLGFYKDAHAQRTWVGLTEEEENEYNYLGPDMHWVIQEIEAKLKKKKNT